MLMESYFEAVASLVHALSQNPEPIRQAATMCADTLAGGGAIHIYDSGHMVSEELVRRAGGLVAFNRLAFDLQIEHSPGLHERPGAAGRPLGYIAHIFEDSALRPGDVLFIGSVSGRSALVVELARQARAHGLRVIAVTSVTYSSQLASEHPAGSKLYEEADLVLHNGAPYGDAMLRVEGLEMPVCPASGIGAACVLWAVIAGVVEQLLACGIVPSIYPSVNLPGGPDLVEQVEQRTRDKGY